MNRSAFDSAASPVPVSPARRSALRALAGLAFTHQAWALDAETWRAPASVLLDGEQSDRFRAWMTFVVAEQFKQGPSPRWYHRDCAGLVRFAAGETLRVHDQRWRHANGFAGRRLPPEPDLSQEQERALKGWNHLDGSRQAFVTALTLIQENCRPLGRQAAAVRPGDLLFFDQGDDQHLMISMGTWIAYHNGQTPVIAPAPLTQRQNGATTSISNQDTGLRAVTPAQLQQWKDTRWRTRNDNPNFVGYFRLAFLSR